MPDPSPAPEPTIIPSISELKNHIGKRLGPSPWTEVGQERIDRFAEATGDRQWIHVDAERAAVESPFGCTVAHGYLTLALAPVLLPRIVEVRGASMVVNYGLDKMRLPTPVPSGSRVRLSGEIKNVRELKGGAARVVVSLAFEVEGEKRPACTADAVYVYFP
ncbi:MAG: MaoC family dehydratase [Myxococcota bacterium]